MQACQRLDLVMVHRKLHSLAVPISTRVSAVMDIRAESRPFRRSAMTLVEMSIVIFVVSAVFFLLIGWMNDMQARAKRADGCGTLAELSPSPTRAADHRHCAGPPDDRSESAVP